MSIREIEWIAPDTSMGFTHTRIERSTDSTDGSDGTWAEFTTSNEPNYTADGMLISYTAARDLLGSPVYWYRIRFYDNVNAKYSEYSSAMKGEDYRGYCTIEDVRAFTNIQSGEYSDSALQMLIDTMSEKIEKETNRVWSGIQTVTDEYLDSDGQAILDLPHGDIQSITSLAIDEDDTGAYTSITISEVILYSEGGYIALGTDAEVTSFPNGRKRILISYTYGNSEPSESVRMLCILMVANSLKMDVSRTLTITELKTDLKRRTFSTV